MDLTVLDVFEMNQNKNKQKNRKKNSQIQISKIKGLK